MSTARPSKVRVTQTLLTSWEYSFKTDDGYESFLKTLNREKTPPTKAMLDGIRYENCLNSVLLGEHLPPDHEWFFPITEMAEELPYNGDGRGTSRGATASDLVQGNPSGWADHPTTRSA